MSKKKITNFLRIVVFFEKLNNVAHKYENRDFYYNKFIEETRGLYKIIKNELSLYKNNNNFFNICKKNYKISNKNIKILLKIINDIEILYITEDLKKIRKLFSPNFYQKTVKKVYYFIVWEIIPDFIEEKFEYGGIEYYFEFKNIDFKAFLNGKIDLDDNIFCEDDVEFNKLREAE